MTASSARQVLYIDDDASFGFLFKRTLERIGHRVTVFDAPQAALDALSAKPEAWDLVITDYRMPGLSGLEVAKTLRERHPGLPCAVISHYLGGDTAACAFAAGVDPVLPKPCSLTEFERLVERLLPQGARGAAQAVPA